MHAFMQSGRTCLLATEFLLLALAGFAAAGPDTKPGSMVVYSNDFEKAPGAEWSSQKVDVTPRGERRFLGQFGNGSVNLTLKDLPKHKYLQLSFELYIIRTFDGADDFWSVKLKGGPELLNSTFGNGADQQTFPDNWPGPWHACRTGAAENNTLGYDLRGEPGDSVYRLSMTFRHTSQEAVLSFWAKDLQNLSDESWGLDNVKVEAFAEAPNTELKAEELEKLWEDLAGHDPNKAFAAIWELAGAGDKAVELLDKQLAQIKPANDEQLAKLIQQLDDREWTVREKATQELSAMGKDIEPILQAALNSYQEPEIRFRIRKILKRLGKVRRLEHPVSFDRGIRVLQAVGSGRAWKALGRLSVESPFPSVRAKAQAAVPEFREFEEPTARGLKLNVIQKAKWKPVSWNGMNYPRSRDKSTDLQDQALRFRVNDKYRFGVWIRYFDKPVDFKTYPILVVRYRASKMNKKSRAYHIWLDDGTGPNAGGETPFRVNEIVSDGEVHELRKDLRELELKGSITGMALGLMTAEATPATYELLSLHFEVPPKAEEVEVPSKE